MCVMKRQPKMDASSLSLDPFYPELGIGWGSSEEPSNPIQANPTRVLALKAA